MVQKSNIMTSQTDLVKQEFAKRLHNAMDKKGYPVRGRARILSKEFHISDKGAGKWLNGDAIPETSKIPLLAAFLGVKAEWLLNGNTPESASSTQTFQLKQFDQILNQMYRLFKNGSLSNEQIDDIDQVISANAKILLDKWMKSQTSSDDDAQKTA